MKKSPQELASEHAANCTTSPRDKFDISMLSYLAGYQAARDEAKVVVEALKQYSSECLAPYCQHQPNCDNLPASKALATYNGEEK